VETIVEAVRCSSWCSRRYMGTRCQWWTTARSGGDPITGKEEEDVNEVCHSLGQLFEEEGGKGLTGW
jgi:hypothetical protein